MYSEKQLILTVLPRNQSDDTPPPPPPVFSKFINWVHIYCNSKGQSFHSVAYESECNSDLSWWTLHLIQLIICMWYLLLLLPFNWCFDKTETNMFCHQRRVISIVKLLIPYILFSLLMLYLFYRSSKSEGKGETYCWYYICLQM